MAITKKPKPDAQGRFAYHDAIRFLEAKYAFDSYDFNSSRNHFSDWAAARGVTMATIQPAERESLREEYARAPDGERACPESENFWHWMLSLASPPGKHLKLPLTFRLNVPKVLATFDTDVAPAREAQGLAVAAVVRGMMNLIPEDLREAAQRTYAPKSEKLKPYIQTILGYFSDEFGPVTKFDMRLN